MANGGRIGGSAPVRRGNGRVPCVYVFGFGRPSGARDLLPVWQEKRPATSACRFAAGSSAACGLCSGQRPTRTIAPLFVSVCAAHRELRRRQPPKQQRCQCAGSGGAWPQSLCVAAAAASAQDPFLSGRANKGEQIKKGFVRNTKRN